MKAMILAAGVGSRLRPLTDRVPKALVDVGGKSMLEIVARRLQAAGAQALLVNAHAHAGQVAEACAALSKRLGLPIEISREDELLLDTGGGLKKASWFFADGGPFLVHNVDVLTDVDLRALYEAHASSHALATLFVQDRPGSRKLLFSADGRLMGRAGDVLPAGAKALSFNGVHALSPEIFERIAETGVFSITDCYVRLAREGAPIRAFSSGCYWADIGDAGKLEAARRRAAESGLPL